jgi:hypothetical protein
VYKFVSVSDFLNYYFLNKRDVQLKETASPKKYIDKRERETWRGDIKPKPSKETSRI